MQYHDCSKVGCDKNADWDISEYAVEVREVEDIQLVVNFAREHRIPITVKTTGHSYAGSSTGKGSINIWTHNLNIRAEMLPENSFSDSCGTTTHPHTVKVGGGNQWKEVYRTVGVNFDIVGGGGLSVSAAGGWMHGGGLSAMSRFYGLGVDNLLQVNLVTADGQHVTADPCQNQDLFWAIRGGGGGTFGVVTSVVYKIHPVSPDGMVHLSVGAKAGTQTSMSESFIRKWLAFWLKKSVDLDRRWGGYWSHGGALLYFLGSEAEARSTFVNDIDAWISASLTSQERSEFNYDISTFTSYIDHRGINDANPWTDDTGQEEFYIASRIIAKDYVKNNLQEMIEKLITIQSIPPYFTFHYFLGGAVADPDPSDMALNPPFRKAIYQLEFFSAEARDEMRKQFPRSSNNYFASGLNHHSKDEPDWENEFWGDNLERLRRIKNEYDNQTVFNCYHCLGYVSPSSGHKSGVKLNSKSKAAEFGVGLVLLWISILNFAF